MIILRHEFPLAERTEVELPGYMRALHAAPLRQIRQRIAGYGQPYVEMWHLYATATPDDAGSRPESGYIGESTAQEIRYAQDQRRPVEFRCVPSSTEAGQ